MEDLGVFLNGPTTVFQDNQSAISWRKNGVRNAKHVSIRQNFLRDNVRKGFIAIAFCPSESMLSDLLTKPLLRVSYERLRNCIGVSDELAIQNAEQEGA